MAKFEIGDIVKVVKLDCKWNNWVNDLAKYIGKTGKIKRYDICGEITYGVQFEDDWWHFPEDWLELVEKAEKYWTGKVVCIDTESEDYFVKGKVYKVKNGRIFGENHVEIQKVCTGPITELRLGDIFWCSSLPSVFSTKFVEFKGFACDKEGNDKE